MMGLPAIHDDRPFWMCQWLNIHVCHALKKNNREVLSCNALAGGDK